MAFTNFETKEINCKVVYFGPRGAGKTENLRSVYSSTAAEVKSGLLELVGEQNGHFFEFLPVSFEQINDFHLKLHLYTLPANELYESVSSVILKGVDGFIFVADSRVEALADNIEALATTRKLLIDEGYNIADLPKVVQYNKRDVQDIMPVEILRHELNPGMVEDFESTATKSEGTMETLHCMAKQILHKLSV